VRRIRITTLLATVFICAGPSGGMAQTRIADFEIGLRWPQGTTVLTCTRGCDWELTLQEDATDFSDGGTISNTAGPNKFKVGCEHTRCEAVLNGKGLVRDRALSRPQVPVANFEIAINAPTGETKVTCSRGCDWASERTDVRTISFQCETDRCVGVLNAHGKVIRDMPR
jgi:hypothetical protein